MSLSLQEIDLEEGRAALVARTRAELWRHVERDALEQQRLWRRLDASLQNVLGVLNVSARVCGCWLSRGSPQQPQQQQRGSRIDCIGRSVVRELRGPGDAPALEAAPIGEEVERLVGRVEQAAEEKVRDDDGARAALASLMARSAVNDMIEHESESEGLSVRGSG